MPPRGKKQRKRPATASADGPSSSRRSRRSSTINATMATRSANQPPSVNTAPTASVPPASDAVSTETVLPPELLQTLVSTVTVEVAKQLSAQLSTMLPTPVPVASTDHQSVPTYMQEPSSSHNVPPPQGQQSEAKGPYRPDAIWQRDANFQFSMTFNFNIFQCFSNIWNHLSNFSYLVCISCKIFIR